jgi:hypothetical protein
MAKLVEEHHDREHEQKGKRVAQKRAAESPEIREKLHYRIPSNSLPT